MSKFYNIAKCAEVVAREHAHYIILQGGRNIGKSYQVKQHLLSAAYTDKTQLIYLRREKEDISTDLVQGYFADINIGDVTQGDYDGLLVYQHKIFFTRHGDPEKPELITEKKLIGYAHALRLASHYKSVIFPEVSDIIFEEFVPDGKPYLSREPLKLQEYVSTIFRTREGRCWLIGNTISKLNPYYEDWQLFGVAKMKTHQIDTYTQTVQVQTKKGTEAHDIKIVVESCGAEGLLSRMAFGSGSNQIIKNEYRRFTMPTVRQDFIDDECEELYTLYMIYKNLKFKCSLMQIQDPDDGATDSVFWYIRPARAGLRLEDLAGIRVITDKIDYDAMHSGFGPVSEKEKRAFNFFVKGKIFYSDDMTGTDFMQCYTAMLRRA